MHSITSLNESNTKTAAAAAAARNTERDFFFSACEVGPTSGEKISFPVGITAAFVVVALCVPLVIWRCRRRQRDNNPNPIPPLIENAGGCSNYGVTNNFTSQAGRRKDTNLQRYSSRRKLMNCSSCSDITMPSKDGDRGYASV